MALQHQLIQRPPAPHLAGVILRLSAYAARGDGWAETMQAAEPILPLIINFGPGYQISLGDTAPTCHGDGFAAGLFLGPVQIRTPAGTESVQIDFTPMGAARFWGGLGAGLGGQMIALDDVLGAAGRHLRQRLGNEPDWTKRLDLAEQFVAARLHHLPAPDMAYAYQRLHAARGQLRIDALAQEIGCSRRHLATRFRAEMGMTPKALARLIRFDHALRLARAGDHWAGIAVDCGFADQAHLAREFQALAGISATGWAAAEEARDF